MPQHRSRHVVIGVGNPDRGDDAAGRMVARMLVGQLPGHVAITEVGGEATAVLARLEGTEAAILVDACRSGAAAGRVRRFDVVASPLPEATYSVSTHGSGIADAVELARTLGELPAVCIVYAIEGERFEAGAALSAPVAAAVEATARRIRGEFAGLPAGREQDDA
jgi:hydrogenase maturation protease